MRTITTAAVAAALTALSACGGGGSSAGPGSGGETLPAIALSPAAVTFTATQDGADPAPTTVTVSNAGGGALALPAVSVVGSPAWLAATVSGAAQPYTLTIAPRTASLAPGSHAATVEVRVANASNSPRTVTVRFDVTSPAGACVASAGRQVCAGVLSAGSAAATSSATRAVRAPGVHAAAAPGTSSATRRVSRPTLVPGAATP